MAGMHFYDCRVRLNGSLLNEVPKIGIPAPEVIMLQAIHGEGSVVDIQHAARNVSVELHEMDFESAGADKSEGWTDRVTRAYLQRVYGTFEDGRDKTTAVFGNSLTPIPTKLAIESVQTRKKDAQAVMRAEIEDEVRKKVRAEIEAEMRAKAEAAEEAKKVAALTE